MNTNVLLRSQRNDLFNLIQKGKYSHDEFGFSEKRTKRGKGVQLIHLSSNSAFTIDMPGRKLEFKVSMFPGNEFEGEAYITTRWNFVSRLFRMWLKNIKRETTHPDFWAALENENQLINSVQEGETENSPFTQIELIGVKQALQEIKAYLVKSCALSDLQTKKVEARFDYLERTATHMGRKDWVNIVISNLLGVALTLSLSGSDTKDLFSFAGQVFKQLLGSVLYLTSPH